MTHAKKTYSWLRNNIAWSFVWGYMAGLFILTSMKAVAEVMQ